MLVRPCWPRYVQLCTFFFSCNIPFSPSTFTLLLLLLSVSPLLFSILFSLFFFAFISCFACFLFHPFSYFPSSSPTSYPELLQMWLMSLRPVSTAQAKLPDNFKSRRCRSCDDMFIYSHELIANRSASQEFKPLEGILRLRGCNVKDSCGCLGRSFSLI